MTRFTGYFTYSASAEFSDSDYLVREVSGAANSISAAIKSISRDLLLLFAIRKRVAQLSRDATASSVQ